MLPKSIPSSPESLGNVEWVQRVDQDCGWKCSGNSQKKETKKVTFQTPSWETDQRSFPGIRTLGVPLTGSHIGGLASPTRTSLVGTPLARISDLENTDVKPCW